MLLEAENNRKISNELDLASQPNGSPWDKLDTIKLRLRPPCRRPRVRVCIQLQLRDRSRSIGAVRRASLEGLGQDVLRCPGDDDLLSATAGPGASSAGAASAHKFSLATNVSRYAGSLRYDTITQHPVRPPTFRYLLYVFFRVKCQMPNVNFYRIYSVRQ